MLWKISAALVALYLVHGAENVAKDSARVASGMRTEAPAATVAMCVEKPDLCQHILKQVTGIQIASPGATAPALAPSRTPTKPAEEIKAPPVPVIAGEFPLPPIRPASLAAGKRA